MPKSRASFLKRQREMAKKEQRQAKLQRKLDRRAAASEGAPTPADRADAEPQTEPAPEGPGAADL